MSAQTYTFLEKNYTIGKIKRIEEVKIGVFSENHFITTNQGRFFLKRNRDEIAAEIEKIEFIESFFAKGKFPILLPIPTNTGAKHVKENGGCYTLYPFIKEKMIPEKKLSYKQVFALGKLLGGLHVYSLKNKKSYSTENIFKDDWNKEKSFAKINELKSKILSLPKTTQTKRYLKIIDAKLTYIENENCVYNEPHINDCALVHGDFHYGNVFFNAKSEVISLFDFEKQKVASISGELGRAIMLICFNNSFENRNFARVRHFLKGYQSERKVSKKDLQNGIMVYITKLFFSYWFENEKFNKGNDRLDKLYTETTKTILYLEKNKEIFIQKILKSLI